jgi:hypothetical protein
MSGNKKAKTIFGLVGSAFGAVRAVADLRKAKGNKDKLALGNALASILVVITGAALAIRELRKAGEDE